MKLNSNNRRSQNGAILAIALIILFLLSILGLAVMKTSSLEEKMAANSLHYDIAFQAAETASQDAISNTRNMANAYDNPKHTINVPYHHQLSHIAASSTVSFVGEHPIPGESIGVDSGLTALLFTAVSTGAIDQAKTSTTIIQGFSRRVPSAQ